MHTGQIIFATKLLTSADLGFYRHLQSGSHKARAVQLAMRDLRERYPHPFYWAPFMLVGQANQP